MSNAKSKDDVSKHLVESIADLQSYAENMLRTEDPKFISKIDKLSYWITDWSRFLEFEDRFNPMSLRRYKRGEIIKVHLGFNVGSEEGGLHYAVVVEKNNNKSSPVVTVVPLTSLKPKTDVNNMKPGQVYLGNELFTNLQGKLSSLSRALNEEYQTLIDILNNNEKADKDQPLNIHERIASINDKKKSINKIKFEIGKMKKGSIALVSQITTISKIRIYDPKTDLDILSGIKLSNEKLDKIDDEILTRFTKSAVTVDSKD